MTPSRLRLLLAAGLFILVVLVFSPALRCGIINLDDPQYVQDNPILAEGFSLTGIERAFTTIHAGYWIPLTWISYLVDHAVFGLNPAGYHLTNVLLHAANAALLFLTLCRMTKSVERSFFAAALFALHPIQVESVVWVTERKDVLSTFFLVLAILAYARYCEQPGVRRYLLVVLSFVLGLMAKPMLVTLPVLLLLLDVWPLGRQSLGLKRLVVEKLPLFLLAFAAGLLTIWTQKQGDAVRSTEEFSLYARFGNAIVNYFVYLRMVFWPYPLAVWYPHPGELPLWQVVGAALLLLYLTGCCANGKRFHAWPFLLVMWLWYLVALAPVSGILQAGWQGRADRFLYVPSIGFFIWLVWNLSREGLEPIVWRGIFAVVLVACIVLTVLQQRYWRDSLTMWEHTIAVTDDNFTCRDSLAAALMDAGRPVEAIPHLERAIELAPDHPLAHELLRKARKQLAQE